MKAFIFLGIRRGSPIKVPTNPPKSGPLLDLYQQTMRNRPVSLDLEDWSLRESIVDPNQVDPANDPQGDLVLMRRAIAALDDPRLRSVLLRRAAGDTLKAIADDLGITRERVRQLQVKGLAHLKVEAERLGLVAA